MNKHHARWTKEEESVLLREVKNNPHNLMEAFRRAAVKLERSPKSCQLRWYLSLKKGDPCFTVVGRRKASANSKNIYVGTSDNRIKIRVGVFKKIINLLFG